MAMVEDDGIPPKKKANDDLSLGTAKEHTVLIGDSTWGRLRCLLFHLLKQFQPANNWPHMSQITPGSLEHNILARMHISHWQTAVFFFLHEMLAQFDGLDTISFFFFPVRITPRIKSS